MTRGSRKPNANLNSGAKQRKELDDRLAAIAGGIALCFPELEAKSDPRHFIQRLIEADRPAEWNQAMAGFVTWGLRRVIPPERLRGAAPEHGELRWRFLLGRLEDALSQGFFPRTGRPRKTVNVGHDADILLINAPLKGKLTTVEAARILIEWDHASLLPGQDWHPHDTEAKHADRARKRAQRAAKLANLDLADGEPFGGSPSRRRRK